MFNISFSVEIDGTLIKRAKKTGGRMGFFSGAMTYRRFWVDPVKSFEDSDQVIQSLKRYCFSGMERDETLKKGWVNPKNLLDVGFDKTDIYLDGYLLLSLRIDQKKIPSLLLKAALNNEITKYLLERDKEQISKKERDLLRRKVVSDLMKGILPSIRLIESCLNLNTGELFFFSSSNNAFKIFEEYFKSTFPCALTPYTCSSQPLIEGLLNSDHQGPFNSEMISENIERVRNIEQVNWV